MSKITRSLMCPVPVSQILSLALPPAPATTIPYSHAYACAYGCRNIIHVAVLRQGRRHCLNFTFGRIYNVHSIFYYSIVQRGHSLVWILFVIVAEHRPLVEVAEYHLSLLIRENFPLELNRCILQETFCQTNTRLLGLETLEIRVTLRHFVRQTSGT